jgi:hypothetical protein
MRKVDLNQSEIKTLLEVIKTSNFKKKNFTKSNKTDLFDKLAKTYVKNFDFKNDLIEINLKKSNLINVSNEDIQKLIIHFISILTGYPENSIGINTNLDNIGMTPIKRETLRRRINNYLSENGYNKFITPSEMNKCDTVKDLFELAISKTK